MRYVPWVSKVFHTVAEVSRGNLSGGVGHPADAAIVLEAWPADQPGQDDRQRRR